MKKLIGLFTAALFFSIQAFSQATIKPAIGINVTDFSTDANGEAKGKVGFVIGGSIAWGTKFYFEPGIFYVNKSTKYTSTGGGTSNIDPKINGIRIPVNVGLNLLGNKKSTVSVRVFGGGSAFFITSTDNFDKDLMNTTSWGVHAGAGIDFWKVFVDFAYEWSLTNIQKDASQVDVGKTRSLFLTAGFRFRL